MEITTGGWREGVNMWISAKPWLMCDCDTVVVGRLGISRCKCKKLTENPSVASLHAP
jgi:hypothetical protein